MEINPWPLHISIIVLPRPVQLRRYTNQTPRLQHNRTQKDRDKTLVGLPRCSRLEYRCSALALPVPHNCGKSHPSFPSLQHSRIQTASPHTAHSHTNGLHCPRRDHPHMRFTRSPEHCMWQSTCCIKGAPPGHQTMGQTHISRTDEVAYYHSSTYEHKTALYNAPYAPYPQRPTPRHTSKGGHSEA